MQRLIEIASRPRRMVVGLNSGTSMDGIDAAIVACEGAGPDVRLRFVAHAAFSYPDALRRELLCAPDLDGPALCRLHRRLGTSFAEAAKGVVGSAGLTLNDIDLVGSHGQTVVHLPAGADVASTMQIGDPDVVAYETGLPVVADFRAADVAAGGAGAPLMPRLDAALFGDVPGTLALNLGGILAWTHIGEDGVVTATDAGPCNVPLDLLAAAASGGVERFDASGRRAARGRFRPEVFAGLIADPWLTLPFPKTTGRERYGSAHVTRLLATYPDVPIDDLLATHLRFTGECLRLSLERRLGGVAGIRRVIGSGGGLKNPVLLGVLAEAAGCPVESSASAGIPGDAKEAVLFALLANERIAGIPANIPSVTGATRPVLLGKISGG